MLRRLLLTSSLLLLDSFPFNYRRTVVRTCKDHLTSSSSPFSYFCSNRSIHLNHSFHHSLLIKSPAQIMPPSTRATRSSSRVGILSASKHDEDKDEREKENVKATVTKNGDDQSMEESSPPSSSDDDEKTTSPKRKAASTTKSKKTVAKKKASPTKKSPAKKGSTAKTAKTTTTASSPEKKKRGRSPKGSNNKQTLPKEAEDDDNDSDADTKPKASKKPKSPAKKKASDHQRVTEKSELPKLWNAKEAQDTKGSYTFRVASWNVAGLRAVLRKDPIALTQFCQTHDLDMLCLQETKLQESHLDDPKLKLPNGKVLRDVMKDDGYEAHWSCSTAKKGYSGTAIFLKQKHGKKGAQQKSISSFFQAKGSKKSSQTTPKEVTSDDDNNAVTSSDLPINSEVLKAEQVVCEMGQEIDAEGRMVLVDFPFASIANVYVPNSGQKLERLSYRTEQWDKDFLKFMMKRQADRSKPVIWLGDLNIAHTAQDVWNDGAKHLDKQAGVTPQERASFQEQLDAGFIDAFRQLHPTSQAHYTYWSQRAGNREPNKGLRLDYFICSPDLFVEDNDVVVRDSYMIQEQMGSDHCPVILELELKKTIGESLST